MPGDDEILDFLGRPVPLAFRNQPTLASTGEPLVGASGPKTTSTGMAGAKPKLEGAESGGGKPGGADPFQIGGVALKGADLLKRVFKDAGFTEKAVTDLIPTLQKQMNLNNPFAEAPVGTDPLGAVAPGSALDPAKFTLTGPGESELDSLVKEGGLTLGASDTGSFTAALGEFAPYLPYVQAALSIADVAGNQQLSDEQKAVGGVGAAASAAAAAGLAAAGAAPLAGPVGIALGYITSAIMESMTHIPHAVREAWDADRSRDYWGPFHNEIDRASTPEELQKILLLNASGSVGGGYPGQREAFATSLAGPAPSPDGKRTVPARVFGKKNQYYPTATWEELLANPDQVSIATQHGLSRKYLDPLDQSLTGLLRQRLHLFQRAQQGDPAAVESLRLIKARGDLLNRQEAEAQQAFEASQARLGEGMSHDGDSGGVGDQ